MEIIKYDDEILAIEISSYCNLKCPMCTQSRVDYNKKGFMDFNVWRKIIDDFAEQKSHYKKFLPFGLGEPFFHPQFNKLFEYLLERNKKRQIFDTIIIHTNALFMDKAKVDLMLKYIYEFGAIHFSLDAATEETYNKVRPGGDFNLAMKNILYLIEKRKQIPPKLVFQFIVMKNNYHEGKKFLELWSGILKKHNLEFQVNYDWWPEMRKDTIFFKRENTRNPGDLGKAEELHKKLMFELGLIKEIPKGRILKSDEVIK